MTKQEFIKKWNVAFEDREQQLEFAREMKNDLNAIIAGGSVCLTENEISELANIGSQHLYTGANDETRLSHGGVVAILERYEELCKIERYKPFNEKFYFETINNKAITHSKNIITAIEMIKKSSWIEFITNEDDENCIVVFL